MRLASILAMLSMPTSASADRLEWSAAPVASGSPSVFKYHHAAAVDPWGDRYLAVGNFQFSSMLPAAYGFPDSLWTPIDTTWGPNASYDSFDLGVLDRARQRLVIIGQSSFDSSGVDPAWQLALDPDAWTSLPQGGEVPAFLNGSGLAADSAADQLVLFGGRYKTAPYGYSNEAWSAPLAGSPSWTKLAPLGGPPPPRRDAVVASDDTDGGIIVFGGWNGSGL